VPTQTCSRSVVAVTPGKARTRRATAVPGPFQTVASSTNRNLAPNRKEESPFPGPFPNRRWLERTADPRGTLVAGYDVVEEAEEAPHRRLQGPNLGDGRARTAAGPAGRRPRSPAHCDCGRVLDAPERAKRDPARSLGCSGYPQYGPFPNWKSGPAPRRRLRRCQIMALVPRQRSRSGDVEHRRHPQALR
jgi:hypothetical protein